MKPLFAPASRITWRHYGNWIEPSIRRFPRYQVGEGIEKKKEDLAAEVAKTIGQTGGGSGSTGR